MTWQSPNPGDWQFNGILLISTALNSKAALPTGHALLFLKRAVSEASSAKSYQLAWKLLSQPINGWRDFTSNWFRIKGFYYANPDPPANSMRFGRGGIIRRL